MEYANTQGTFENYGGFPLPDGCLDEDWVVLADDDGPLHHHVWLGTRL